MSRFRVSLSALCLAGLSFSNFSFAATFSYTQNAVTYTVVEADPFLSGGSAGNTVNMNNPGQFWAQNTGGNQPGLYNWRDFGGMWWNQPAGAAQSDRDLFEVSSQTVAPPNLRTTVNVPNGTYDVYLAFMVEADRPSNPIPAATFAADLDVGQTKPTTMRGGRTQPGLILTGLLQGGGGYEIAMAPLGTVTGTSISAIVGPMWAGDLNGDYKNGQDDLTIVLSHWGQTVAPGDRSMGNTNDDTTINQADLTNIVNYWGAASYPAGFRGDYVGLAYAPHAGAVPEPSAVALFLLGGAGLALRLRGRAKRSSTIALAALLTSAIAVNGASASIVGWFAPVATEGGDVPPAGYVSQDLTVNATTDWLATNMRVVLTAGTVYQDIGAGTPSPLYKGPDPTNFPFLPSLRWDTYVTNSLGLAGAAPNSAGGAPDLGGSVTSAFSTTSINLNWYTTSTTDTGTFTLGRFTLSNGATGTWQLRLDSLNQGAAVVLSGNVVNGVLAGTSPPTHAGDFDSDGDVDGADFVAWQTHFPTATGATLADGDADGDHDVDGADFVVWQTNFPFTPGPGSSPVPEPQSAALVAICAAMLAGRWCHKQRLQSRAK